MFQGKKRQYTIYLTVKKKRNYIVEVNVERKERRKYLELVNGGGERRKKKPENKRKDTMIKGYTRNTRTLYTRKDVLTLNNRKTLQCSMYVLLFVIHVN